MERVGQALDQTTNENDRMTPLDERILRLLVEQPCRTKADLQRELGHSNPKRVVASLRRLIMKGTILPEGFYPKQILSEHVSSKAPTGFVVVQVPASAQTRLDTIAVLKRYTSIGKWRLLSGEQGEVQGDFAMILYVLPDDLDLARFYADLLAFDNVSTRTYWMIG